jgi:hypothetical protein
MRILLFWLVVLIQLAVLCHCFVVMPSPTEPPVQAPSMKAPTMKTPTGKPPTDEPKGGKPTKPEPPTGQRIVTRQPTIPGQSTESNSKGLQNTYIVAIVAAAIGATALVALLIYVFRTKMAIPQPDGRRSTFG